MVDEVFGHRNFLCVIPFSKSSSTNSPSARTLVLSNTVDYLIWYAKDSETVKYRQLFKDKSEGVSTEQTYIRGKQDNPYTVSDLTAQKPTTVFDYLFRTITYSPLPRGWRTTEVGMNRLNVADRIEPVGNRMRYRQFLSDYPVTPTNNLWSDTGIAGFVSDKRYVVETSPKVVQRCILMTTDPGDLVLDPTCGSGTTAHVAEQWGRRWITIDTSRVALALARSRVMGARYPYYLLADSPSGREKESELTQTVPSGAPAGGDIRQGFVYERVPHITLKAIANNAEIDVIWERWQETLEPLRAELNGALGRTWEEWEIPREAGDPWPEPAAAAWKRLQSVQSDAQKADALIALNSALRRDYTLGEVPDEPRDPWDAGPTDLHRRWWEARIARQKEIDASIAAKADFEYLYDKPYEDRGIVRVAGPFTVESLAPHRTLGVGENDELIDHLAESKTRYDATQDFATMILEHLKTSGVQQAHRDDRISFTALTPWPGNLICAEGRYLEGAADTRYRAPRRRFRRPRVRHRLPSRPGRRRPRSRRRRL